MLIPRFHGVEADPDPVSRDAIVPSRSSRYNLAKLDYGFIKQYPKEYFVGLEAEFQVMRKHFPALEWLETGDMPQLAGIIAGAR